MGERGSKSQPQTQTATVGETENNEVPWIPVPHLSARGPGVAGSTAMQASGMRTNRAIVVFDRNICNALCAPCTHSPLKLRFMPSAPK
ncbi:hypothetical protein D4764_07G0004600 [Takifugu flavidus]|uniref:Uncharacterized protein n=1 Tax=Takifugu flavidus TaxID=433684 RepID=A0A5C6MUC2_9TELE|nr:hypothetical protein D4764_07G0004600 [Takifugu flavidus]